jgi:hypothetical protein
MQPAQRRRRRFAELLPVGTGHPAHMGEAEIEGDIDDARLAVPAMTALASILSEVVNSV